MLPVNTFDGLREKLIETAPYWRTPLSVIVAVAVFLKVARGQGGLPPSFRFRREGLDLLLAGKPVEAEKRYREGLNLGAKLADSDRVRLLVCLADALTDQGRYREAEECLNKALQLGDPSGSGQGSMADVLLLEKKDPEKAIEFADQALRLSTQPASHFFGDTWSAVQDDMLQAKSWSRKAQALAQLDRRDEARQAVERAIRIVNGAKGALARSMPQANILAKLVLGNRRQRLKDLTICDANWQISQALLALQDSTRAAEHLRIVRDTDRMGKYRKLAQAELERLGSWAV